jgi:hypothetical protein
VTPGRQGSARIDRVGDIERVDIEVVYDVVYDVAPRGRDGASFNAASSGGPLPWRTR